MGQQGSYPIGARVLAAIDTLTGVVTGKTADVPLSALFAYVCGGAGALSPAQRVSMGIAGAGANGDITSLTALTSVNSGYLYGNRVINGAMEIDQVNAGAAITPTIGFGYGVDMFGAYVSQNSKLTFQQVLDAPAGLRYSTKITVASQYTPASTDSFQFQTAIEGKDLIDFQLGYPGAATFTFSFWVKGSIAGTYAVSLLNAAANRSYVGTVNITNSWSQLKITVAGDLTGTWATDNTTGLYLRFDLGSGANYNTTAGTWQAGQFNRTAGSVTFVNQVAGSTLNITGVDCRLGSVAPTVFERRLNELQLSQRYLQSWPIGSIDYIGNNANAGQLNSFPLNMKATMRGNPTWGGTTFTMVNGTIATGTLTADACVLTVTNIAAGQWRATNTSLGLLSARLF
jgi:hypothetical protein